MNCDILIEFPQTILIKNISNISPNVIGSNGITIRRITDTYFIISKLQIHKHSKFPSIELLELLITILIENLIDANATTFNIFH